MRFPEVMVAVVKMAHRLGVKQINKFPGCWEIGIDDNWWIAVNGHRNPRTCSKGVEVMPFSMYVEWNGFPAGICGVYGGVIAACSEANETTFIEACARHG